jgi:hypothetical protein
VFKRKAQAVEPLEALQSLLEKRTVGLGLVSGASPRSVMAVAKLWDRTSQGNERTRVDPER